MNRLLQVVGLSKQFRAGGWLGRGPAVRAVEDVNLEVGRGETLGLVGESGCGKSTLARLVVRLIDPAAGRVFFDGTEITRLSGARLRALRRRFQMIFQDPMGSLNPRMTVEAIVGEPLAIHRIARGVERRERVLQLLLQVGLGADTLRRYPHELSGGQRQRIGTARALALSPDLVVADEPTSALDVSVRAQILNLLLDLKERLGLTYLFIAHDLPAVERMSDRIAVMYLGRIVELGPAAAVAREPLHPYTQALVQAIPVPDPERRRPRLVVAGEPPDPAAPPAGCAFHPRCPISEERCRVERPELREIAPGRWAACHKV